MNRINITQKNTKLNSYAPCPLTSETVKWKTLYELNYAKKLDNKCYARILPSELDFHHILPTKPDISRTVMNPDENLSIQFYLQILIFRFWSYSAITFLSSFFLRASEWVSFTDSWTWDNPFLFFILWEWRWGSNQRPHCYNLTPCLRRHCRVVD